MTIKVESGSGSGPGLGVSSGEISIKPPVGTPAYDRWKKQQIGQVSQDILNAPNGGTGNIGQAVWNGICTGVEKGVAVFAAAAVITFLG